MTCARAVRAVPVGLAGCLLGALPGCGFAERASLGSYQHAVARESVVQLDRHGIEVPDSPGCSANTADTANTVVQVRCTGRTGDGRRFVVTGGGSVDHENYTLVLEGGPTLRW